MYYNRKSVLMGFLVIIASMLYLTCTTPTGHTGTATETENVAAILYNPHGSPAAHAKVKFYPRNYNPRTGGLGKTAASTVKIDSTTTDANGNYIAKLDTGTYTILASGDSGLAYQDSITVIKGDTTKPVADTLKPAGSIKGVVQLQPGDDARTVFILFMGTHSFTTPDDAIGNFTAPDLAEGKYRVRILTTLDNYAVMDTSLSAVAGKDSVLPGPIQLRFTGFPVPTGLKIAYDTLKQIVTLTWNRPTTGTKVQGYRVYRKRSDSSDFVKIKGGLTDTVYRDSMGVQDQTYEYRVAVLDTNGTEGVKSVGVSVTIVGCFILVDSINFDFNNTAGEVVSLLDGKIILRTNDRIQILDSNLSLQTSFNLPQNFGNGFGVAVDDSGRIWASNYTSGQINIYSMNGLLLDSILGAANFPNILVVGPASRMYVVSTTVNDTNQVRIYGHDGNFVSLFPNDSTPLTRHISDILFDGGGNLVAFDHWDSTITKYSSDGTLISQQKLTWSPIHFVRLKDDKYLLSVRDDFRMILLNSILQPVGRFSPIGVGDYLHFTVNDMNGRLIVRNLVSILVYR
jgi:hypothetical protein